MLNNQWFDNDCYLNRRIYVCKRTKDNIEIIKPTKSPSSSNITGTVVGVVFGLLAVAAIIIVIVVLKRKGKLNYFSKNSTNISNSNFSYKKQDNSDS